MTELRAHQLQSILNVLVFVIRFVVAMMMTISDPISVSYKLCNKVTNVMNGKWCVAA